MNKRFMLLTICLILIVTAVSGCRRSATNEADDNGLISIRVGWQIPWATQGQLVQVLIHTDILRENGLEAYFVGRTFGPELNEAALANQVDVILTADQPAATLFSRTDNWIGIGRLMYNRTTTYVPVNSPINTIADLRGRTIGMPIGAAAERITLEALMNVGLSPADVNIVNVGINEQVPLVNRRPNAEAWGNIDALSGFDPIPAIFESNGLIRVLDVGKVCSLVLMNGNLIQTHPDVAERFMNALIDAYDFYRNNITEVNAWFIEASGLRDLDDDILYLAASIEPNLRVNARNEIRVWFIDEDFEILQRAADFVASDVNMRDFVTNDFVSIP